MRYFLFLVICGVLSGCATPYQKMGLAGGYDEMKLGQDLYQVTFKGNGFTGSEAVQKHFLRRCAEIAIEKGFEYFALINQEAEASRSSLGSTYNGTVTQNYYGGYNYSGTANTTTVTRHGRTGVIKLFKEGTQPPVAYDAKEILKGFLD